jgi:hypothetical protein
MSKPDATKMLDDAKIKDRDMLLVVALHFIHSRHLDKAFISYLDGFKKEKT